jgi:hypothetical protein
MKTPHLRNVFDKVGRFNVPGPQISGFGLLHDGSVESVVSFLRLDVFFFPGQTETEKDVIRRQLHHYIMAFDTGMAPAVGRQLTIAREVTNDERQTLNMLATRASAGDCDLIARGWKATGSAVGYIAMLCGKAIAAASQRYHSTHLSVVTACSGSR